MEKQNNNVDKITFSTSFIALFLFWIIISSSVDLQHLAVGIIASLAVTWFSSDLLIENREAIPPFKKAHLFMVFIWQLFVEIIKANIDVARIVLDPKLPISPAIVKFKTRLKGDRAKVTLANSITLTPGTVTLDIVDDTFYVHTLTKKAADEVTNWPIEDLLVEVENAS